MTTDLTQRGEWTSASSAEADRLCAGRHSAQKGLPDTKSEDAQAGTAIHDWLHWRRTGSIGPEPVCDYELAARCWEMEQQAVNEWHDRLPDDVKNGHEIEVFSERRFWITVGGFRHSGQADAVYRCGGYFLIIDSKSGFGEVTPPATNEQLRDLAVLMVWQDEFPPVSSVEAKIVQPWAKEKQPPCVYDREALKIAHDLLVKRVIASNDPNAKRTPGEVQCQFCKARGTGRCPESQLAVVTVPTMEVAEIPSAKLLEACLLAEPIIKLVKERARAALKANPDAIPGFTLKENPPNKPITDPGALWARCSTMGLTLEQFMACIKVSKGDLEEALKQMIRSRDNVKAVKGCSATWLKLLDGITSEESKEPSVVRRGG